MLKKVTFSCRSSLSIELAYPGKTGYAITSIDGLGPVATAVNLTERANMHGGIYKSSRSDSRNLSFDITIVEKTQNFSRVTPTVELLRQALYTYFPLNEQISIEIETDTKRVRTYGYVERHEPEVFSRNVSVSISMICPEAFFRNSEDLIVSFSRIAPGFSFPFQNNHLTSKLIEFGEISNSGVELISYLGDTRTGFLTHIHAKGTATNISMFDGDTLSGIVIDTDKLATITGGPLVNGDDIFISSERGHKYAKLVRGPNTYNIQPSLGKNPNWLELKPGFNNIAYLAESGVEQLTFKIVAPILYEGV